jgi:hypothetical protein
MRFVSQYSLVLAACNGADSRRDSAAIGEEKLLASALLGYQSVERFEAFSVLASGCRQLAQTSITDGAKRMLRALADDLDQQASGTASLGAIVQSVFTDAQPAPSVCG